MSKLKAQPSEATWGHLTMGSMKNTFSRERRQNQTTDRPEHNTLCYSTEWHILELRVTNLCLTLQLLYREPRKQALWFWALCLNGFPEQDRRPFWQGTMNIEVTKAPSQIVTWCQVELLKGRDAIRWVLRGSHWFPDQSSHSSVHNGREAWWSKLTFWFLLFHINESDAFVQ